MTSTHEETPASPTRRPFGRGASGWLITLLGIGLPTLILAGAGIFVVATKMDGGTLFATESVPKFVQSWGR